MGAHTIGHVHIDVSGYGLNTTGDEKLNAFDGTPNRFDNEYFISLLNDRKTNTPQPEDIPRTKNLWGDYNYYNSLTLLFIHLKFFYLW